MGRSTQSEIEGLTTDARELSEEVRSLRADVDKLKTHAGWARGVVGVLVALVLAAGGWLFETVTDAPETLRVHTVQIDGLLRELEGKADAATVRMLHQRMDREYERRRRLE